jgi:hypothetical protein
METKVFLNRTDSLSLRATIPRGVVSDLKLKDADSIHWELESRDGKIVAVVTKAEG